MDFIVEFFLRNLFTLSNFVRFRNSRNFTFFETSDVIPTHDMSMWMPHGILGGVTNDISLKVHLCE